MKPAVNNFMDTLQAYLQACPDVLTAISHIHDAEARLSYLRDTLQRIATEQPEIVMNAALTFALAMVPAADLAEQLMPGDPPMVIVLRGEKNRRTRPETIHVNGEAREVPPRAGMALRQCVGVERAVSDKRAVADLLEAVPELEGEITQDDARSGTGKRFHYLISERLAGAVEIE